jgi:hypothetical protein
MGGLCARSCARGATRNSTSAAQICRMAHGLTSEHEMVQDFLLVSEEFGEGGGVGPGTEDFDAKLNG